MKSGQKLISNAAILVSLVFLLGFLTYWNVNNYNNIKRDLQEDLRVQMRLAEAEFADSVMYNVFNIVVDKSFHNHSTTEHHDSLVIGSNFVTKYDYRTTKSGPAIVGYGRKDEDLNINLDAKWKIDTFLSHLPTDSLIGDQFDNNGALIQRQKDTSIIQKKNISIKYLDGEKAKLLTMQKGKVVKENFLKYLSKSGLPTSFRKINIEKGDNHQLSGLVVQLQNNDSEAYQFYGYGRFILRQLCSTIVISLLLFGLISLSFYLIRKNNLEQMRLAATKNEFVANMAHELKTPISTVGVALEALKKYGAINDPVKTEEYIDISQRELSRLQILVDKVLKMSTLDEEIKVLQLEKVDLNKITQGVLDSMRLRMEQRGVVSHFETIGDGWIVDGDTVHLTNVVYNLIDNGVKYGGDNPVLYISLKEEENTVSLAVRDEGQGIAKEHQQKIFNRFYRVPTKDVHTVKGHGLGLNYTASVVRELNGKISISSAPGEGSEFIIQLPKSSI